MLTTLTPAAPLPGGRPTKSSWLLRVAPSGRCPWHTHGGARHGRPGVSSSRALEPLQARSPLEPNRHTSASPIHRGEAGRIMACRARGFHLKRSATLHLTTALARAPPVRPAAASRCSSTKPQESAGGYSLLAEIRTADMPWKHIIFTATVMGGFYALDTYYGERTVEGRSRSLPPEAEPLPTEVLRVLPDGRMLMPDGSIVSDQAAS